MALVGNFPGVYPTITDLSQVVTANSVTSCAYVGEAEFGPINTPTLITNKKGYVDRFGEITRFLYNKFLFRKHHQDLSDLE